MKNRIRTVRKDAGLTQEEFAKRIGVSRNTVATYETSARTPIDAIVISICREFDVREEWLRTGCGEKYQEVSGDMEIARWIGELLREGEDSYKRRFVRMLTTLGEDEWKLLEKMTEGMSWASEKN